RPALERLTALERHVERMVQTVLLSHPATPPSWIPAAATSAESRRWARATAGCLGAAAGSYRGVAIVPLWGRLLSAMPAVAERRAAVDESSRRAPTRSASLRQRPHARRAAVDEDDARPGTWMIRPDEPMESVEDPMGLQRPADRDEDTSASDLADAL